MAKLRVQYACQECGATQVKWMGRCPSCGGWNTLQEEAAAEDSPARGQALPVEAPAAVSLDEVAEAPVPRFTTGLAEVDRVLGGGLVPGSLVLLGGDPGVGKSTLVLQACAGLAASGRKVLYASGEESVQQVHLRARRLGVLSPGIRLVAETQWEKVAACASAEACGVLVVDSIQTLFSSDLPASPGTVSQVRECAVRLMALAKSRNLPVFLIGHVTKDGSLAGPRVLEHLVDAVLTLEGDADHSFRMLRASKNRFGNTRELGLFEMREQGLAQVSNPSEYLLRQRGLAQPGACAMASLEGSRPLLVEVQALVTASHEGAARRSSAGVDPWRLNLLYAVLEKRCGIPLHQQDVFVSVAGGFRLQEPAADLALAAAVSSSLRDQALPRQWIVFGEVGLGGEVRPVKQTGLRLKEAARFGFKHAVVPWAEGREAEEWKGLGIAAHPVKELGEALAALWQAG